MELWQSKLRVIGSHFIFIGGLAGDRDNIDKGWETEREAMSPDGIFKPLDPAIPEMFHFRLFDAWACIHYWTKVFLYFLKVAQERDLTFFVYGRQAIQNY